VLNKSPEESEDPEDIARCRARLTCRYERAAFGRPLIAKAPDPKALDPKAPDPKALDPRPWTLGNNLK